MYCNRHMVNINILQYAFDKILDRNKNLKANTDCNMLVDVGSAQLPIKQRSSSLKRHCVLAVPMEPSSETRPPLGYCRNACPQTVSLMPGLIFCSQLPLYRRTVLFIAARDDRSECDSLCVHSHSPRYRINLLLHVC